MIKSFFFEISELSVGRHWYWSIANNKIHGEAFITTWFVLAIIMIFSLISNRNLEEIPTGFQNLTEYFTEYIRDIAKTQIGDKDYSPWVPFLGTIFIFIFVSNWSGALLPWHIIELPDSELASPTNDINTCRQRYT